MTHWARKLLITILLVFPAAFILVSYLEDLAEAGVEGPSVGIIALVSNLPRIVINLAVAGGYVGIFTLMLLEAAALPIPSEIILPLAGYLVSQGTMDFWLVVLVSTVASIIGSFADYFIGLRLSTSVLAGRSRIPYVDKTQLHRTRGWFDKYGPAAVALLRLVPAARVLVSFPAGAYKMSKGKFGAYTLAGCLPWNIILVYLGWSLGSSWEEVVAAFRYINLVAYVLIVLMVAWFAWRLISKRNRTKRRAER
jgi:membrane protein DedA with SNARE-associated domain